MNYNSNLSFVLQASSEVDSFALRFTTWKILHKDLKSQIMIEQGKAVDVL